MNGYFGMRHFEGRECKPTRHLDIERTRPAALDFDSVPYPRSPSPHTLGVTSCALYHARARRARTLVCFRAENRRAEHGGAVLVAEYAFTALKHSNVTSFLTSSTTSSKHSAPLQW